MPLLSQEKLMANGKKLFIYRTKKETLMEKKSIAMSLILSLSFPSLAEKFTTPTPEKTTIPKPNTENKTFDDIVFDWSGTFAEVLRTVGEKHYKISDAQECMIKAINSFLNCLDPHSSFLDPKTYKAILETTTGQFFGIGIIIDNTRSPKDKVLTVINTIPEGPAEKAGVKAQDKIIEIDGKKLEGMTTEEATAKLRGERNTKVSITVLRDKLKNPLSLEIVRDTIKHQSSLAFYIKEHNIYYVSLATFSNNAVRQIGEILKKSATKPYKGIILDLRNNSGGLLNAAIDVAGLFLEKGSLVVVTKDKENKSIVEYKTGQNPVTNVDIPIFILVNNYTASASEILAGCLKIHSQNLSKKLQDKKQKRLMVFIVGTKTFGKGSVQEVIPVSNNCAIKLTSSLYFLPNDIAIQGIGIEPDFVIPKLFPPPEKFVWFMENYGREEALKHSIKPTKNSEKKEKNQIKQSEKTTKSWAERIKETLEKDNQFIETLQLINVFHLIKQKSPENVKNRQEAVKFLQSLFAFKKPMDIQEVKN